jgi:ketosteroid isomerase-like protein
MSQEDVEIARTMHEAFNNGNEAFLLEHLHPDLEWEEDTAAFPGIETRLNTERARWQVTCVRS